jgi:hypothetical protein
LVVIAVIALLASIVLVVLNGARVKARDTRRKALYYDVNGRYPIIARWATSEVAFYDDGTKWASLKSMISPYVSKLSNDPLGTPAGASATGPWITGNHHYAYSSYGIIYDLVTQLESISDPDRCQVRATLYHQGEAGIAAIDGSWCGVLSSQMHADH